MVLGLQPWKGWRWFVKPQQPKGSPVHTAHTQMHTSFCSRSRFTQIAEKDVFLYQRKSENIHMCKNKKKPPPSRSKQPSSLISCLFFHPLFNRHTKLLFSMYVLCAHIACTSMCLMLFPKSEKCNPEAWELFLTFPSPYPSPSLLTFI